MGCIQLAVALACAGTGDLDRGHVLLDEWLPEEIREGMSAQSMACRRYGSEVVCGKMREDRVNDLRGCGQQWRGFAGV